jgi:tetratricopeptide (TPR) repeat protein
VITIDYPADGSIFPPEITPPTFIWHDGNTGAVAWSINISFDDGSPAIEARSSGERMSIGEIDPRCGTDANRPALTPEQASARTWIPEVSVWAAIKSHSVNRPAMVTITGFRDQARNQWVTRGKVSIQTSKDPVGAPVFYRDVPLMPSEGEKGVIRPLAPNALGLIKWRLRYIGEPQSRTVLENLPTCANCHSFSLDGKTLGLDVDGPDNDKGLYALVSVKKNTVIRNEDVIKWATIRGKLEGKLRLAFSSQVSPDGHYVLNTIDDPEAKNRARGKELADKFYVVNFKDYRFLQVFYPTRGILAWYSRETGHLQPLPGANDPHFVQTDGVWSPDGKYIVFARAEAKEPYPEGGKLAEFANDPNENQIQYSLYRVPFNEGRGGQPERIAGASDNGMSNNFPKVSPDGRWIIFVRCRNGQLMRPDSQLYIVPFEGGRERRMNCNTRLMNSWHSFSPNGRWLAFSSKSRSPFTQMYLTHLDENGNDSPAILVDNTTAANRAVNIPEFVNIPPDGMLKIDAPATEFFRVFNLAVDLTQKKQYDAALVEWQKAVGLNGEDAKAHFNLALALQRAGRVEEAIQHYQKATEVDPENESAYTNLSQALARTGRLNKAIACLKKCLAVKPDSVKAHGNLAAILVQEGRNDEAIEHCEKALAIDPANAGVRNTFGVALSGKDRLDEAISQLEQAVAADPGIFEYQYNLGRFLAAKGRFGEAIPHFEQAVNSSGGREPLSLEMLASMYDEVGRIPDAVQAARQALDIATQQNNQELAATLKARISTYQAKNH